MGFDGLDDIINKATVLEQTQTIDWHKTTINSATEPNISCNELFTASGVPGPGNFSACWSIPVGSPGSGTTPNGTLCLSSDGNIWFASSTNGVFGSVTIVVMNNDGIELRGVTSNSFTAQGMCLGPDNLIWTTQINGVSKITLSGVETTYTSAAVNPDMRDMCSGPDGNIWVVYQGTHQIARWTTSGVETIYTCTGVAYPQGICAGPDGNIWVSYVGTDSIAKWSTAGVELAVYPMGGGQTQPFQIIVGSDNRLWVIYQFGAIGAWTTAGVETIYTPANINNSHNICSSPDGNIWISNWNQSYVVVINTSGNVVATITPPNSAGSMVVSADGLKIWVSDVSGGGRMGSMDTTLPGTSVAMDVNTPGALPIVAGTDSNLLNMQVLSTNTVLGTLILVDFLLVYKDLVALGTGTPSPAITISNTITLPRYTDGVGVFPIVVATSDFVGITTSFTFTCTDNNSSSQTLSFITDSATIKKGTCLRSGLSTTSGGPFAALPSGVDGIKSMQSYVINTAGTSSGSMSFVLVKPLAVIPIATQYQLNEMEYLNRFLSLPNIKEDACLGFLFVPSSVIGTTISIQGRAQFIY